MNEPWMDSRVHFGVNHLGHYLLTRALLPQLVGSGMARIVNVSSGSHFEPTTFDASHVHDRTRHLTGLPEYEFSKLCNVLFTAELRRRLKNTDTTCVSLHPGQVRSAIWHRIPQPIRWFMTHRMLSCEQGADNVLHCAVDLDVAVEPALFYDEKTPVDASPIARDPDNARTLWDLSAQLVGLEP